MTRGGGRIITTGHLEARAVEQRLIGLSRGAGPVLNRINSISPRNLLYQELMDVADEIISDVNRIPFVDEVGNVIAK